MKIKLKGISLHLLDWEKRKIIISSYKICNGPKF